MKKTILILFLIFSSNLQAQQLPPELTYPPYTQNADKINIENIKKEFKMRRWSHVMLERSNMRCWKMQKRIIKAIEEMRKDDLIIPNVTDEFVFSKTSPLNKYKKMEIAKVFPNCSFASYGNLNDSSGIIYCKFHGIIGDLNSDFAKKHRSEFMSRRPFCNAVDALEFLFLLPGLILLSLSTFIMHKVL